MNVTDIIILVIVAVYAWGGWANGFISNFLAGFGLLAGFLAGSLIAPMFFTPRSGDPVAALLAIFLVVGLAVAGSSVGGFIGRRFPVGVGPIGAINRALGLTFSVGVALAASWAVGYAITAAPHLGVTDSVRSSTILAAIDDVMPARAGKSLRVLTDTITVEMFPRYLDPFQAEVITEVGPADPAVLDIPGVRGAASSVAKVFGNAVCDQSIVGSGVVYAKDRVMTNAHVVAGVAEPFVTIDGKRHRATTVVFDPNLDLAVLKVPGLGARPLDFDRSGAAGDRAAVLGFPENGPFHAEPARIRTVTKLRSPDIHHDDRVTREVYSLRAVVKQGNSGGPLISPQGRILGIVFAASQTDGETGYAMTANQVKSAAAKGIARTSAVDTGACV